MLQNLGSPPLVTLRRPPPPLTCDVIYGWPLTIHHSSYTTRPLLWVNHPGYIRQIVQTISKIILFAVFVLLSVPSVIESSIQILLACVRFQSYDAIYGSLNSENPH